MEERERACLEVEAQSSAYLDGRLDDDARSAVQDHLRACPACVRRVRALQRLGAAARDFSCLEPPTDLAARVRQEIHRRRRATLEELDRLDPDASSRPALLERLRSPLRIAAAAAAVLLCSLGAARIGYVLGSSSSLHELSNPGASEVASAEVPAPVAPADQSGAVALHPVGPDALLSGMGAPADGSRVSAETGDPEALWAAYRDQGFTAAEPFSRASRCLLGDLSSLDSVDEHLRRPLIASQVEYFDLQASAEQLLDLHRRMPAAQRSASLERAAVLVLDLAHTVESGGNVDLVAFRQRARDAATIEFAPPPAQRTQRPVDRAWQVVRRVAPNLPSSQDSSSLVSLLQLRDSYVYGDFRDPIEQAFVIVQRSEGDEGQEVALSGPRNYTIALSLREVDLGPLAIPFEIGLDDDTVRLFVTSEPERRVIQAQRLFSFEFPHRTEADFRVIRQIVATMGDEPNSLREFSMGDSVVRIQTARLPNGSVQLTWEAQVVNDEGDANAESPDSAPRKRSDD